MRVALVHRNVNFSGRLARCVALLAGELARKGVEVHCFCNPALSVDTIPGVQFHAVRPLVGSGRRLGSAVECASFATAATRAVAAVKGTFDIVDVYGPSGWAHDVVTVHGVARAQQERWPAEGGQDKPLAGLRARAAPLTAPRLAVQRAIEHRQFRPGTYSRVIAVSERVAGDLTRLHDVSPERIDVIAPPVDVVRFGQAKDESARRELGLDPDERFLLFVGHDFERKGLDHVLIALAGLDAKTHLVVVGGGDATRFRLRSEQLGVAARVHFVGNTPEPERFFRDAALLVHPTKNDPWGVVLLESMAAGLPVVTTGAAGAAPIVSRSGAGVVLSDPTPVVLRAELRALLRSPERLSDFGAAGRAAASEFGIERHAERTLATYEQSLRERSGERPFSAPLAAVPARPRGIATLPRLGGMNPYQRLLYEQLGPLGFELVSGATLRTSWLRAARPDVDWIHIHWPQALYTYAGGPASLRPLLSWLKLGLLLNRLRVAKRLGYRLAWTIHQVYPHDRPPTNRDKLASRALARASDVLIAHDDATADAARRALGAAASSVSVVPHGSYVDVYPAGRPRPAVRSELGISSSTFLFLVFGEVRAHKELARVLEAFAGVKGDDLGLLIAGMPKDAETIAALEHYAADDPRVTLKLEFVFPDAVAELFDAADALIAPRTDGGTSGSLILGPSLGLPTIAADRPVYAEVIEEGVNGWLHDGEASSLRAAMERAASDREASKAMGRAALERMSTRSWAEIARRTAALLRTGGVE